VLEYGRMRAILHASVLVPGVTRRFTLHGTSASWMKFGLDRQEGELVAALTGSNGAVDEQEHAVTIDGASGAETSSPIARGDYRQFYARLRDAVQEGGENPVPPPQAVAVTAVVETAIRSSSERRSLTVPLTDEERAAFQNS